MDHRGLFKTKLTIRGGQSDRRQHLKTKRAVERDNIRNFGRDITNSPLRAQSNDVNFKQEFKKKYREVIMNKQDQQAALIQWRPPFVSVVPVGKYIDPPATTALAKRITKTQENIKKTLTAKKVFPAKTPETVRRSKRNVKRLILNSIPKNNPFNNYLKSNGREDSGFKFVHSTTAKNNNNRKKSIVLLNNNFEVSDEDDLDGISPIENASDDARTPNIPLLAIEQIESNNQNGIINTRPPPVSPKRQVPEENITLSSNNYVSSYVTTSRGKNRRETKNQFECINNLIEPSVDDSEEMKMNREAALKYENLLNDEKTRLQELNQKWELYRSENMDLTDCVEMIDGTVGQTKLLMSSKFLQFHKLIDNCRFQNGDRSIFPLDLEGFWDVVKLQIKNVDDRFEKLEKLRDNGWKDDIVTIAKVVSKKNVGKKGKNKQKSVISSLKDFVESKRKEKLEEENAAIAASTSVRKTRQTFRVSVLSAAEKKNTPTFKSLSSPNIQNEINRELGNLNINSPLIKSSKVRGKSIRFIEPRKSNDSDVILVENSLDGDKENYILVKNKVMEPATPTNPKRTFKKYRDTPKIPELNLMNTTPQTTEKRRSVRTPKSKLSFCDELHNCSMRDSPVQAKKRSTKRTRRITELINDS